MPEEPRIPWSLRRTLLTWLGACVLSIDALLLAKDWSSLSVESVANAGIANVIVVGAAGLLAIMIPAMER